MTVVQAIRIFRNNETAIRAAVQSNHIARLIVDDASRLAAYGLVKPTPEVEAAGARFVTHVQQWELTKP